MFAVVIDTVQQLDHILVAYTIVYFCTIAAAFQNAFILHHIQLLTGDCLFAAEGLDNKEIAHRLDLPRQIVSKWRKRFCRQRLAGLEDRPRRGRPISFSP